MDVKKIRKSSIELTEVVIGLILFLGIFTGMYLYLNSNINSSGATIDTRYQETYTKLNSTNTKLTSNINEIKDAFSKMTEADNTWQVAWNGIKGIAETLKLPINFLYTALQLMNVSFTALDYIPEWVKVAVGGMITAIILFIVIGLLKGEQKM